jgi:hypothetical protein
LPKGLETGGGPGGIARVVVHLRGGDTPEQVDERKAGDTKGEHTHQCTGVASRGVAHYHLDRRCLLAVRAFLTLIAYVAYVTVAAFFTDVVFFTFLVVVVDIVVGDAWTFGPDAATPLIAAAAAAAAAAATNRERYPGHDDARGRAIVVSVLVDLPNPHIPGTTDARGTEDPGTDGARREE